LFSIWLQEAAPQDTEKHVLFGLGNQINNGPSSDGKPEVKISIGGNMVRWLFMTVVVAGIAIIFGFVGVVVVTVGVRKTLFCLMLGWGLISITGRLAIRT
jgi:uncharacterized membrane protein YtjA (UPF0391 family)